MANEPNAENISKILEELRKTSPEKAFDLAYVVADTCLKQEIGQICVLFRGIFNFPGFNPNKKDMMAEQAASFIIQLRECIWLSKLSFERREEVILELKELFLKENDDKL